MDPVGFLRYPANRFGSEDVYNVNERESVSDAKMRERKRERERERERIYLGKYEYSSHSEIEKLSE